jgi:dihydrofolate synthase/folylpolyglutamate synthase
MVFGVMKDKNISAMAKILFPIAENLILTPVSNSRSADPKEILKFVKKKEKAIIAASAADALSIAKKISGDRLIVVTGSLYLVGEVKKLLNN